MEKTSHSEQAVDAPGEQETAFCSSGDVEATGSSGGISVQERGDLDSAKYEVKRTLRSLVERFGLSREDLVSAYDECVQDDGRVVRVERNGAATKFTAEADEGDELELHEQEEGRLAEHPVANGRIPDARKCRLNGALSGAGPDATLGSDSGAGAAMEVEEEGEEGEQETEEEEEQDGEPAKLRRVLGAELWTKRNGTGGGGGVIHRLGSLSDCSPLEEKEEVDKMQTLVQSALRVYEASSIHPEIGQKRRSYFSLEDELTLQPSPFVQELLDRDQTMVAQAIKKYMNQYSVPQREVVEKTGLNQSHLSQHFLHGVTMKRSKRVKLYHWFEDDQRIRTGKPSSADSALSLVLESPKVEGSRRRPRWKWSPISTQILSEAFKKNHFPTREQRVELARLCNEAELTMNNGSPIRGPEGDTEGITEQRVNTWFTNRRKGLSTPSPTRGLAMSHGGAIFTTHGLPTLLRAATPTTPTQSYSHTTDHLERNEDKPATPPSAPVQALVSHVQSIQAVTSAGSAIQLAAGTGSHTAIPLTAITLPAGASVLGPGTSLTHAPQPVSSAPPPLHTFAITPEGIPAALIPPSQLQAILSQVHVSSDSGLPAHIQLANTSGGIFTIPMLPSQKVTAAAIAPSQLQTYTVTPSSVVAAKSGGREVYAPYCSSPLSSPSTYASPTLTALPTLTQSQAPVQQASVPTIIGSNHIQAILTTLGAQGKLQGLHSFQFNPSNSLPLTIALPHGGTNDDFVRTQTLLVNQGQSD